MKRKISIITIVFILAILFSIGIIIIIDNVNIKDKNEVETIAENKDKVKEEKKSDLSITISNLNENSFDIIAKILDENNENKIKKYIFYLDGSVYKEIQVENSEKRVECKVENLESSKRYEVYFETVDEKGNTKKSEKRHVSTKEEENVITAEMIKEDTTLNEDGTHNKYIGQTVTYTGYDEDTVNQEIVWKIFGVDEDTNKILLITDDYVDLSYKTEAAASEGITISGYNIYSSDDSGHTRDTLIDYLNTSSNWSEYAISGKTIAYGAPTMEQFLESYKLRYPDKYLIGTYYATQEATTAAGKNAPGWVIKFSSGTSYDTTYNKHIGTYYKDRKTDSFYIIDRKKRYSSEIIFAYWLASPSADGADYVMRVRYDGLVNGLTFSTTERGVRPLVSLDSNIKIVEENGEYIVK